jgi:hypothetical protein
MIIVSSICAAAWTRIVIFGAAFAAIIRLIGAVLASLCLVGQEQSKSRLIGALTAAPGQRLQCVARAQA